MADTAPLRLFCLPYAGAGTTVFNRWPAALGSGVDVVPIELPGRDRRRADTSPIRPEAVAHGLLPLLDRPFAVFGHSFGAQLGFEVLRALRSWGAPEAVALIVSGCRPPDLPDGGGWYDNCSQLDDATLVARLVAGGGIPAELADCQDLLQLFVPAFRADFGWLDHYRFRPEPPLAAPLVALAGRADPIAPAADMHGWRRQSAASFALHLVEGGHFFLRESFAEVTALVTAVLTEALAKVTADQISIRVGEKDHAQA